MVSGPTPIRRATATDASPDNEGPTGLDKKQHLVGMIEVTRRSCIESQLLDDKNALEQGISLSRGGAWLPLNEEQYRKLHAVTVQAVRRYSG